MTLVFLGRYPVKNFPFPLKKDRLIYLYELLMNLGSRFFFMYITDCNERKQGLHLLMNLLVD